MNTQVPPQHIFVAERMLDLPEFHEGVERILTAIDEHHTFVGTFSPGDMTEYRVIAHLWGRDKWADHHGSPVLFQFGTTNGMGQLAVYGRHVVWERTDGMTPYTISVAEIVLGRIRAAFGHPLMPEVLKAWDAYEAAERQAQG